MKLVGYILAIFLPLYLCCSCNLDSEQEYYSYSSCDTIQVTYQTVSSIFLEECAICHNVTETFREGIVLDSYESTVSSMNTGLIIPAIKHTGPYNMPNNQTKLSDCDIHQIELWWQNGMPENEE